MIIVIATKKPYNSKNILLFADIFNAFALKELNGLEYLCKSIT